MMHGPDFRSPSVRDQHVMRQLDAMQWAPRHGVPFVSLRGAFVTLLMVIAIWGAWTVLP